MEIFVYEDFIELANDRIITSLFALSEDHGIILSYKMTDDAIAKYKKCEKNIDYIIGRSSLDDYDDGAYHSCEEKIREIFSDFFDTHGIDGTINWNIINGRFKIYHDIGEVGTTLGKVLDDSIRLNSKFRPIEKIVAYADESPFSDKFSDKTIKWIMENRERFESQPYSDKLITFEYRSIEFNGKVTNIVTESGDQYIPDEELQSDSECSRVYATMYVYWLMSLGIPIPSN